MENTNNKLVYIYQDGTIPGDLIIKELEKRDGVNDGNFKGNTPNSIYYIEPIHSSINCISRKYKTTTDLIEQFYTEIKIPKTPKKVYINKKLVFQLLRQFNYIPDGYEDDYKFIIDD